MFGNTSETTTKNYDRENDSTLETKKNADAIRENTNYAIALLRHPAIRLSHSRDRKEIGRTFETYIISSDFLKKPGN